MLYKYSLTVLPLFCIKIVAPSNILGLAFSCEPNVDCLMICILVGVIGLDTSGFIKNSDVLVSICNLLPETKCLISFTWSDPIWICTESASSASPTSKLKKSATLLACTPSGNARTPPKNNLCSWKVTVCGKPFTCENTCSSHCLVGGWPDIVTLTPPPSTDSVAVSDDAAVNS